MRRLRVGYLLCAVALAVTACGGSPAVSGTVSGPGEFGATQGGVKDMRFARQLVKAGRVPPKEAFLVEGMFSEHDLPLAGAPCQRLLCLRAALGVADTLDGVSSGWVQVGMSSTIDPDTWKRPPITIVATVDVSGSMGWGYASNGTIYATPGELARRLLTKLAATLGPEDTIAIVTYGSTVSDALLLTPGDRHVEVQAVIDGLKTNGSTNMEAGMLRAYAVARTALGQGRDVRLVLFTDEQPNVGATMPSQFETLVADGARDNIGITVMGLGLGLGQKLMVAMSHLRGGNAFSLSSTDEIDTLIAEDWPWLASPIAHDLKLELSPLAGAKLAETYGFPTGTGGPTTSLDVATVFLSKRRGALLARITPATVGNLTGLQASGSLTYTTLTGQVVSEPLTVAHDGAALDERHQSFPQPTVGRTVALAVLVAALREAATVYGTDITAARKLAHAAADRIDADQKSLGAADLVAEVEFARAVVALMDAGAAQGDLYGLR